MDSAINKTMSSINRPWLSNYNVGIFNWSWVWTFPFSQRKISQHWLLSSYSLFSS